MDSEEESLNGFDRYNNTQQQEIESNMSPENEKSPSLSRNNDQKMSKTSAGFFNSTHTVSPERNGQTAAQNSHPNLRASSPLKPLALDMLNKTTGNLQINKGSSSQFSKLFSVFANTSKEHTMHKKQSTDSFSKDSFNSKNEDSFESSVINNTDKKNAATEESPHSKKNLEKKQKQHFFQAALEVFQIVKHTGRRVATNESDIEEEQDDELQYEQALQEYNFTHKVGSSEMFEVQHKDEFEMLEMYTDNYPLLQLRKKILFCIKLVSYICFRMIKNKVTETLVLLIILFNTATLMMADPTSNTQTPVQAAFEQFFLIAYTIEMCVKIVAFGFVFNKGAYLRDSWNFLDFIIVGTSLLPLLLGGSKSVNLSSLRSLRVLRPLRTISTIPALKIILSTLFSAIPFLLNSLIILFFYILVFAIAALQLFKGIFKQRCYEVSLGIDFFNDQNIICGGYQQCIPPTNIYGNGTYVCGKMLANPDYGKTNFDTIFYSFIIIYQMVTLEGWTQVMYWMMFAVHVATCIFALVLTFLGNNVVVNLTLAIIKAKYTDQEKKNRAILEKQRAKLELQEQNDPFEQEQRKAEEEMEKEEEENDKSSSDSETEIMPSIKEMKDYNRELREQKRDRQAEDKVDKKFNVGQNNELNFVFDDMINLKMKMKEEELQRQEQERQQMILDEYLAQQRKKMKNIFKRQFKKPMADPLHSQYKLRKQSSEIRNEYEGSRRQSEQSGQDLTGHSKLGRATTKFTSNALVRKPSIAGLQAVEAKRQTAKENSRFVSRKNSLDQANGGDQSPKLQSHGRLALKVKTVNKKDDFDIILQDIDEIANGESELPILQRIEAPKRILDLRGAKLKPLDYTYNQTQTMNDSQPITVHEQRDDISDILSDNESPQTKKHHQHHYQFHNQHRASHNRIIFNHEEDDEHDLLNDSDFIQEQRIEEQDKNVALAQEIFKQRLAQQQKRKPQDFRKKANPKLRGFIIHGLQDHLKKINRRPSRKDSKDDDQHIAKMQELVMLTNEQQDQEDQIIMDENLTNTRSKSKKSKIQGKSSDYKLVLNTNKHYFSSSTNDIMEAKLHLRERQRLERLERQIKTKHYIMEFEQVDEAQTQKVKEQKKQPPQPEGSVVIGNVSRQGSVTSRNPNMKESLVNKMDSKLDFSQTLANTSVISKIPMSKSGQIRKIRIQKFIKKYIHDDNLDILFQFEKSINENTSVNKKSLISKSTISKRKRVLKSKIELGNYHVLKKVIVEPIEEPVKPFDYPPEKIYLQVLQMDFQTNIKYAYNFTINDVIINFPIRRANKIRPKMSTSGQEKVIYLAGVTGWIAVRHRELNDFVRGKHLNNFILGAVVGNTVILALNGSFTDAESLAQIDVFNQLFTYIFIGEMGLKLLAFGPIGYLRDKMNIFDGAIVMLSILELTLLSGGSGKAVSAFRSVRIFRTFRVLRVTRLLRSLAFMQVIIKVIQSTLENFIYICGLMFLFCIIYSLLGMQMYGGGFNFRDNHISGDFDSFSTAFLVIFQLLTIENWNDIITLTFRSSQNKFLSSIYLLTWIFIGNYVFLNLFLAILMDGFCGALDDTNDDELDLNPDQRFMMHIEQNLLKSDQELKRLKKSIEYRQQKQKEQAEANPNTPNMSLNNSMIDDDVEIDLVNHQVKVHKPLYQGIECEDSLYIFNKKNFIRIITYKAVTHHFFEQLIQAFIISSSIKLAMDTYIDPSTPTGIVSAQLDYVFNSVFLMEATMKIIAFGWFLDENSYLTESWSQLDFFIVCCSIVDMSFSGINLPFIKILRLLRILRPLRFISHNRNLKTIVIALLESFGGMMNVIIVVLLIWLMFGILGISLLGTRMGYCNVDDYYNIRKSKCINEGHEWVIYLPNWDDIYNAMQSLFILTTLEGWPNIMYQAMDSDIPSSGPRYRNYQYIAFYFISFILVGSFILINLFTGVICYYFETASKNEKRRGNLLLTTEQENWIEIQRMTVDVKVGLVKERPTNCIRSKFYDIVESGYFDALIMICILLNIATMAMVFEESTPQYDSILESINTVFTSVFIAETVFKITAYGFIDFVQSGWNQFDLFVTITSLLDISLSQVGTNASFLRVGPQLIRIVRVLRVTRLLKLVKSMRGLQKLLLSLYYSLPALMNIGALLFLCFFIFAVLAVFLFKNNPQHDNIHVFNNFDNFGLSLMTLYRASTGENWEWIMYDVMESSPFAPVFFMAFLLISTWVMLNLFILIIIQYLENYNLKEDNPLEVFGENLEIFRAHWSQMTIATKGEKMHQRKVLDFFQQLPPPIGFGPKIKRQVIAKEIMNMQLIGDGFGNVYFNELLHASIKRAIGMQHFRDARRDLNLELQQYLSKAEAETRRQIEQNKIKEFKRKKYKFLPNQKNPINPLVMHLFNRMAFITWKNYGILKIRDEGDSPLSENESESEQQNSENEDVIEDDYRTKGRQRMTKIDELEMEQSPLKRVSTRGGLDLGVDNSSSKVAAKITQQLISPRHSVKTRNLLHNEVSFTNGEYGVHNSVDSYRQ